VVPGAGKPQALNRYSYVFNNPLKYVDPSGHDPLDDVWENDFRRNHDGRAPTDGDRRDRLFSLIFHGSGPNGSWNDSDWARYSADKNKYWRGEIEWSGEMAPGIERFATHVDRLASLYKPNERSLFVKAFGLMFASMPWDNPIASAWAVRDGTLVRARFEKYPFLSERGEDYRDGLSDDPDPSHHYAAFLYMGYFFSQEKAMALNWLRDGPLSGRYSEPDLILGNIAAKQGELLWQGSFSIYDLGDVIRYSLANTIPF
jgi:hypothetical protein